MKTLFYGKDSKMINQKDSAWDNLIAKRISQHLQQFHAADSATLRRTFLRGVAGLGIGSWFLGAQRAQASPRRDDGDEKIATVLPNPIPGGAMPLGILVHHFPLPSSAATPLDSINDPSEITDFNGFIGDTHIRGAGSGTGFASPLAYQTDMGFMQGEYIGQDGRHHHGTFCFI